MNGRIIMIQQDCGMDVYTVIDKRAHDYVGVDDFQNKKMNLLVQAHRGEYEKLKQFPNVKLLIDSGAYIYNFSAKSQSEEKTRKFIEKYLSFVKETKNDKRIQGYFDMDLLYLGLPSIRHLRDALLSITPNIIAVYHPIWGINEFKHMCRQYDNISICGNDGITSNGYTQLVKYAHKHGCYVHGLGINDDRQLKKTPFNSVDSAGWNMSAIRDYYFHSGIPKTPETNRKYRPLYERKYFLKQLQRQEFYKNYWKTYFTLLRNKRRRVN